MIDLNKYKQVIFDCDGVILDSNKTKSEAFAQSIANEDIKHINQFIDYHKKNGGISRFVKFEHFFKVIKKETNYKYKIEKALQAYANLSYNGLLKCNEIRGIRDILNKLKKNSIDCFVISGGEQQEVRRVLKKKGFSHYFKNIYGSPTTKKAHLANIETKKTLYFGDAKSDYDAAIAFDIDFIFISGVSEWVDGIEFCKKNNLLQFKDFKTQFTS